MKTLITLAFLCLFSLYGCKKSSSPSNSIKNGKTEDMQVIVGSNPLGSTDNITLRDYTNYNGTGSIPPPFFSVTNIYNSQTTIVKVYSGEDVNIVYNFDYPNVPQGVFSLYLNGTIIYRNPANINGVAQEITIP